MIFSPRFTLPQAEMLISRTMFEHRISSAARMIQAAWRGAMARAWYKRTMARRIAAVTMIRRNYLLYRFLKMGPIMRKKRQHNAVCKVQAYMRGYSAKKKYLWSIMEKKTDECHAHFTRVRKAMIMDANIKICYHVFRYVARKRKQKAEEEERKRIAREAAAKKKKNKYAPRASMASKAKANAVSTTPCKATPTAVKTSKTASECNSAATKEPETPSGLMPAGATIKATLDEPEEYPRMEPRLPNSVTPDV